MNCLHVQKLLHAHLDSELSGDIAEQVQNHLEFCSVCSEEAEKLKQLFIQLEDFSRTSSPLFLTPLIMKSFQAATRNSSRIHPFWSILVCYKNELVWGMAAAGFFFGLFLGNSLFALPETPDYLHLLAYADMEGLFQ